MAILETSDTLRLPRLLPIRYGRMSSSPFAFFRGSAAVMAQDLVATPVSGSLVQLCGDAHLSNFGVYGTPERAQVFDINDFDETLPGPWEWDVKRLATSLVLAGRENGLPSAEHRRAVRRAVRAYREAMLTYGRMPYLDIWYTHLDAASVARMVEREGRRSISGAFRKARRRTNLQAFPGMTRRSRGEYRIRDAPPLILHYRNPSEAEESTRFFERYLSTLPRERRTLLDRYRVADVARRVVGVGSVGTRCSVMLLLGDADVPDPLFLQVKEALPSVLESHLGASDYPNHAERVVVGQRLIQEASDIFLGWSSFRSRDYYVRQLRDMKFSPEVSGLGRRGLAGRGEICGASLARAHARTGDPAEIAGYLGEETVFDRAIARFAEAYADQVETDYQALRKAIRRGRLPIEAGS
ncbi:MAG: DUF2252 domain-containing protein [Thermoplasmata archaeon]|nr:DUF2252 domain-containing protein [Thermoplasmata archaeon]